MFAGIKIPVLCPWAKQEALHALSFVAPRKGRLLRMPQRRPPSDGEAAKARDNKTTNFIFSELPSFVRKVFVREHRSGTEFFFVAGA